MTGSPRRPTVCRASRSGTKKNPQLSLRTFVVGVLLSLLLFAERIPNLGYGQVVGAQKNLHNEFLGGGHKADGISVFVSRGGIFRVYELIFSVSDCVQPLNKAEEKVQCARTGFKPFPTHKEAALYADNNVVGVGAEDFGGGVCHSVWVGDFKG